MVASSVAASATRKRNGGSVHVRPVTKAGEQIRPEHGKQKAVKSVLCSGTPQPAAKQRAHVPEQGSPPLYFRSACSGTRLTTRQASIGQGIKYHLRVCKCPLRPCRLLLPSLLFVRRRHLGGADGGGQGQCAHAPQANTHAAPPPCRPTTCTTRGGDLPHPTCIDIPASPWEPGALRRLRPIGGGREGGIFLSGSSGWCWSAKQWGVEPRARHDLHLAWWGGRDGRGGVGMKGVASCTPTLQGRRCANTAVNAAGAWRAAGRRYARR